MSKTTTAIEAAVQMILAQVPAGDGGAPTARQRAAIDKAFTQIMRLIAPRVRHFIRQYGLSAHWDDAEQCCAIAVHRAIQTYDQEKAQFTTFVNWLIRGELQSLRFRLMTDQRPSARKVEATTVSLQALSVGEDGEDGGAEVLIEDENALSLTEAGASDYLAGSAMRSMTDSYVDHLRKIGLSQLSRRTRPRKAGEAPRDGENRPRLKIHAIDPEELEKLEQRLTRNRALVEQRLFEIADAITPDDQDITKERMRQITKRAAKTIAEITGSEPKFLIMAEASRSPALTPRARAAKPAKAERQADQPCPIIILPPSRPTAQRRPVGPQNYPLHERGIMRDMPARSIMPGRSIH
ncbi:sigma-70 family RNA polymerase sigma factor [Sphingomonas sp. AP4-R1]|uniref:sigma factor n=1 Tax=Sphingomonas sp. AP4-R1 TaxID=2735134 RepID=UPI0014936A08|nr:sigma factor [Sphingomonas sp. AP4-R1]QJU57422.1 sigma-70 family RNA polymerase sigma factor [Sphingomonas sp. AP4-R1]